MEGLGQRTQKPNIQSAADKSTTPESQSPKTSSQQIPRPTIAKPGCHLCQHTIILAEKILQSLENGQTTLTRLCAVLPRLWDDHAGGHLPCPFLCLPLSSCLSLFAPCSPSLCSPSDPCAHSLAFPYAFPMRLNCQVASRRRCVLDSRSRAP